MPRVSPEAKVVKKALRKLEQTMRKMADDNSTEWENTFMTDVKARLEEFGSAFSDMEKGDLSQALSILQNFKVSQINRELKLREKMGMKAARNLVLGGNKMKPKRRGF